MKTKLTLSKSQFMKGENCPLSLWFYKAASGKGGHDHNHDHNYDHGHEEQLSTGRQAAREMGDKVGALAREYFSGGKKLESEFWQTEEAAQETLDLIAAGETVIYEGTAINPDNGTYCSIDILRKVPGSDQWDMIEVKSATRVKDYYVKDAAFQRHVFEAAGYSIRNSYLLHINPNYVRGEELDVKKLFRLADITKKVSALRDDIEPAVDELMEIVENSVPPPAGQKCTPRTCDDEGHCWDGLPLYSIFNAYAKEEEALAVYKKTGSFDINDIPEDMLPQGPKRIELDCHRQGRGYADQAALQDFVGGVKYPIYYLDYETVASAIPLYSGSRPYQQVPFQFSLHVQEEEGGELSHISFLHKEDTDPRRAFIEALITVCGDEGSVIVYNQKFEEGRNKEMARDFPEYAEELNAISARMIDLYLPFQQRWLYHPDQNGSASIKKVLPTFTDLSYDGMAIANGEQAYQEYLAFVEGKMDKAAQEKLWAGLEEYCGQDTYAMVVLLDAVREIAENGLQEPEQEPLPAPLPGKAP